MTFKNEEQLRKFLLDKCANAVDNTKEKVHQEFVNNLNRFYAEYDPIEYVRTGALAGALESTNATKTGNSVTAKVYFNIPQYRHGWVPLQSGEFGYSSWDDELILDVTMKSRYPHGGYAGGTPIWTTSMRSLGNKSGIRSLLKQELKKQGL